MATANLVDFQNIFSLEGKVAVVTGSSRGLGLAAASGILQAGASKVYITSRSASGCEEACAILNALPNKRADAQAIPVPADSSTVDGIQELVDAVSKSTDHVDILLINAGMAYGERFEKHDEKKWTEVMDINLKSVFYAAQRFAPLLTNPKYTTLATPSRIIVTASVSGIGPTTLGEGAKYVPAHPPHPPPPPPLLSLTQDNNSFSYAAAKAGAIHLVRQLALELGPRNVLANSIAPGFFPSDLAAPLIARMGGERALARSRPNGRLGRGEDFAGTVVWLASRAGSHVTGQCIVLDGGGSVGKVVREEDGDE
ncbi:3-oxoacyl-(acyl-carrier-protein) reductase FabG [Lasiodiplodia hormozganensis]|uniref:3-oxoacyl-(Acyl-carrier-protein) reductase FabG n=2 Tax=Lasiodiplodia TaxID=66739 RepID=A0AA39YA20_9PEZI|nr:3-oxoacyl-(acyl-carrier-protein) reductase FabG [Lasiodiplodia hormozganensis]